MHHSENVDSVWNRTVEDDDPVETSDAKDPQRLKRRIFQRPTPSHFRLCGKKSKGFVCGDEESVAQFGASFCRVIIGLFLQVSVRSWADNVT